MEKLNCDKCRRDILYNSKNLSYQQWQDYCNAHKGNAFFRSTLLESPDIPSDLISDIVQQYALFSDQTLSALLNPQLSVNDKIRFVFPTITRSDLENYINTVYLNKLPVDAKFVDFIIENYSYDDIRINAYRLIDTNSKFYPLIKNKEYSKLIPELNESKIQASIVDNPYLPLEDRINAFENGCDIIYLTKPPKELMPEIIDAIIPSLIDGRSAVYVIMMELLDKFLEKNLLYEPNIINKIIDTYINNNGNCIAESLFLKCVERLTDKDKLNLLVIENFTDNCFMSAAIQNPKFDRSAHSIGIDECIEALDAISNPSLIENTMKILELLIRNSTLTDDLYDKIINSEKMKIIDFVAKSYYTPENILEKISDKFPENINYKLFFELNKNEDKILPSVYDAMINFICTAPHLYPFVMTDNLYVNSSIKLEDFKNESYDKNHTYNRDLKFIKERKETIEDESCYKNFIEAMNNVLKRSYTDTIYRKLDLLKHYFEHFKVINDFCNNSPVSEYISFNYEKMKCDIDYSSLHNADIEKLTKQIEALTSYELSLFQTVISYDIDLTADRQSFLQPLLKSVSQICDKVNELKNDEKSNKPTILGSLKNSFKNPDKELCVR